MKKLLALCMFFICLISCFTGCKDSKDDPQNSGTPTHGTLDNTSPSLSPLITALPEVTYPVFVSPDPIVSNSPEVPGAVTPTPVPTPTPTIRPAQKNSICPPELLTAGYTTPLDPASVKFPANYKMPYYIEVDVTNQCVNVFIKNDTTGAYDILLNRFVFSGGTTSQPTRTGNFYIKTDAQQRAATGQVVKYQRYYFQKYQSYAYYITRYSNEYMFHSFTFEVKNGQIVPKKNAYYNMGNPGSAGCLRMFLNHAKWISDNIDPGTYVTVNKFRAKDSALKSVLRKYIPPLGYDMTAAWDGNKSNMVGLVRNSIVANPDTIVTNPPVTATPTPTETPIVTPPVTPTVSPSVSPETTPEETPIITTPSVTPNVTPTIIPATPAPTGTPEEE